MACGVLHVAVDDRLRGQGVVAELHQGLLCPDVLSWQSLMELDPMSTPTR